MSASSTSRRSLASRRRSSGAGTKLLGAVKLHSPLGAGSDAGEGGGGGCGRRQRRPPLMQLWPSPSFPCLNSLAGSPCSTASDVSALTTPQDRSPLVVSRAAATAPAAAAAPAAADALAQFGQQLSSSRSSDRWLEERLASPSGKPGAGDQGWPCRPLANQPSCAQRLNCVLPRNCRLPTTSTLSRRPA